MLSLGEAARQAGVAKTTIHRAIKSGKISAQKKDDGSYSIDPAELFRAFPAPTSIETVPMERSATPPQTSGLDREVSLLRERIEDLKADRDAWRAQAERLLLTSTTTTQRKGWWPWR